jgi:phospholipid/cholesterol/gamma-HCH transport system substrate-binding protein
MKSSPNRNRVLVGLFVFLGIVLLIIGIMAVGNIRGTFTKKIKVVAFFDDVNGLQKGNNVWFSGVKIGMVDDLNFYDKSLVSVTININIKAQEYIRKDAKVKISSDGLIGNKILVIYGGTSEGRSIMAGDTLEVENTFSSEDMINMAQENNKNLLAITSDLKIISAQLASGEGTVGKLLMEKDLYEQILSTSVSLNRASAQAAQAMSSMNAFTQELNKEGNLAYELVTDTTSFPALQATVMRLEQIADSTAIFINNLKTMTSDPSTPIGVMLHDEQAGVQLKQIIENLESSSYKLDEDLEAIQHNFLLRGFFKKREKERAKEERRN